MNNLGKLSEAEMEVMQAIWELANPVTVSQLLSIFEARKGWKTSTLSTILARLIEKGFLTKSMKGKANIYEETFTQEEYRKYETKSFMHTVHGGSVKSFMTALVDDKEITLDELSELKAWFRQKLGDE